MCLHTDPLDKMLGPNLSVRGLETGMLAATLGVDGVLVPSPAGERFVSVLGVDGVAFGKGT